MEMQELSLEKFEEASEIVKKVTQPKYFRYPQAVCALICTTNTIEKFKIIHFLKFYIFFSIFSIEDINDFS